MDLGDEVNEPKKCTALLEWASGAGDPYVTDLQISELTTFLQYDLKLFARKLKRSGARMLVRGTGSVGGGRTTSGSNCTARRNVVRWICFYASEELVVLLCDEGDGGFLEFSVDYGSTEYF
jgi:hypothetical protein